MWIVRRMNSAMQNQAEQEQTRPAKGNRRDPGDSDFPSQDLLFAHDSDKQEGHPHRRDGPGSRGARAATPMPTTNPAMPATAAAGSNASASGAPALVRSAAV